MKNSINFKILNKKKEKNHKIGLKNGMFIEHKKIDRKSFDA